MTMTHEEAIKELIEEWEIFIDGCGLRGIEEKEAKRNSEFKKIYEAHKMAIQALKQEPKTGYWRHYEGMLICSECGDEFYDDIMEYCGDDVPKCCPNCGCRMVEPQKSEG